MKRSIISALSLLILCAALIPFVVFAQSGTVDCGDGTGAVVTLHEGDLSWLCATATPEPSNTPTDEPTSTPVPASATNTPVPPTVTVPPKPTQPTPAATWAAPRANAPWCPLHNKTEWHPHWDGWQVVDEDGDGKGEAGCYYDHVHGSDPRGMSNYVVQSPNITYTLIYGEPGAPYGGQSIGYPFETALENLLKHNGYTINTAIDLPCQQWNYGYIEPNPGCIRSFRLQFHDENADIGKPNDNLIGEGFGRFHSFYPEAELCTRDYKVCGLVQGLGALMDTGEAHMPYKAECVNLGNRPLCPDVSTAEGMKLWMDHIRHTPPYWAFDSYDQALLYLKAGYYCFDKPWCFDQPGNIQNWENGSTARTLKTGNRYGLADFYVSFNWRTHNATHGLDTKTSTFKAICPLSDCNLTGDASFVYELAFWIPPEWDTDGSGIIENMSGFTDVAGRIDTKGRCKEAGAQCVPFSIRNVVPGLYIYDMASGFIPLGRNWGDGVVTDSGARYFDQTHPDYRCPHDQSKRCSRILIR